MPAWLIFLSGALSMLLFFGTLRAIIWRRAVGAGQGWGVGLRVPTLLRRAQERYELAMAASRDGIWDCSLVDDSSYFSPRCYDMLGYAILPKTNSMQFLADITHPDDLPHTRAAVESHFLGQAPYDMEQRLRIGSTGEYRWFHVRGQVKRSRRGKPLRFVGSINDVTARRQELEELVAAREAALAGARARQDFLANMSHEIRTPMHAVLGFTELLSGMPLPEEASRYVALIRNSGAQLLSIINDILDLSKLDAGKLQIETVDFDPRALLEGVLEQMAPAAAAKGLSLQRTGLDSLPAALQGAPTRLAQIITNLLSNAIKFTHTGGVHVLAEHRHERLRIAVKDSGIGIDAAAQASLFQPFVQADMSTHRRYGGTGLGLSISRRLADLLGGVITMASQAGQGSTFMLEVPAPSRTALPPPAAPAPLKAAQGQRILVAEDNPLNQLLARRLLDTLGYAVEVVANGHQALAALRLGTYSLVLMDCQMPEMDGYETTRAIRLDEQSRGVHAGRLPIVALTANALEEDRALCLQCGMDDLLAKPVSSAALAQTLARFIA